MLGAIHRAFSPGCKFEVMLCLVGGQGSKSRKRLSAGLIQGYTAVTPEALEDMQAQLEAMDLGPLLGIFLQSFFVQFTMTALNIVVFVIVYRRMIEIYLMTSLAPIPFATIANREAGHMGVQLF